jgi:DinB family protein
MKRFSRFALVWLAVGFAFAPLRAQEALKQAPKQVPGPAPSQSEGVLEAWNDIGRKLIAMAQDFPEDKFSYKPQAESRTFIANLVHASASMYFFTDTAAGKKPRPSSYADDPKDVGVKTRAELVAFVTKCVEDGAAEIKANGDKGLMETVDDGGPHLDRLYDLAYGLIQHSNEHYGQLVVYYRINGLVPPESRPKK